MAGKAPCSEIKLESNTCTTAISDAANATTGTTTKAGATSYTTTDLINGGCAAPAQIVSMEDLMQATTNNFLLKAVAMLGALEKSGVLFKVVTSDGSEYGTLPHVRELMNKKVRRKHGSVSMHIDPYLRRLEQGDVAVIEMPSNADYSINDFQARVSSRMCSMWGAGNGTCHRNENTIEVLRIK